MIELMINHKIGEQDFHFNVTLPPTGITAIFGRSGSGKTTLINTVAGLISPTHGRVRLGDKVLFDSVEGINIPAYQRKIGYVFQESRLFPHMSVKSNLRFGMPAEDETHFAKVTALLALGPLLTRMPSQLSGGEKQRVAIGRALLSRPQLLLMDEPLASLDMPRKKEVLPYLEQLANEVKLPILYVTHSTNEILRLAAHILVIDDGSVIADGSVERVWASDAMAPWQSFSDRSSLLSGILTENNSQYGLSKVSLGPDTSLWVQAVDREVGEALRLQVKANDVSISLSKAIDTSIRNIIPATIESIQYQDSGSSKQSVTVKLKLDHQNILTATITAWAVEELGLTPGMRVYTQIKGVSVSQKDIALSY